MAANLVDDGFQREGGDGFSKFLSGQDLCSESVRMIPQEFLKGPCNGEPQSVVLMVSWGSSWHLWLHKNKRGVFMEEEMWGEFVEDNSLGRNDFLIFTHTENLLFNVKIFKPDGFEMLSAPNHLQESDNSSTTRNFGTAQVRGEPVPVARNTGRRRESEKHAYERDPNNPFFETTLKKSNHRLCVKAQLVKDYDLRFGDTVRLIDGFGELLGKTRKEGHTVRVSEWYKICRRNKLNHNHQIICEVLHTRNIVHSIRVHVTERAI